MRILAVLALLLAASCAAAPAEEEPAEATGDALTNDVLKSALVAGKIGETATGYMAIVDPTKVSDDLKRNLADNTIKRRAVYTRVAESMVWTTVNDVAKQTSCNVFAHNILVGYMYRAEDGTWMKHTETDPVEMPSFCLK